MECDRAATLMINLINLLWSDAGLLYVGSVTVPSEDFEIGRGGY